MPSKYGFESEEDKKAEEQQEQEKIRGFGKRIDSTVRDILADFVKTIGSEWELRGTNSEWRLTPALLKGDTSNSFLEVSISFREFNYLLEIVSLSGEPHLSISHSPKITQHGIQHDNLMRLCEVLHNMTQIVVVYEGDRYTISEKNMWPSWPSTAKVIRQARIISL